MCSGSPEVFSTLGFNVLKGIVKPETKTIQVKKSGLYGENLTGASVNTADDPDAKGANRNLGTKKVGLGERLKEPMVAFSGFDNAKDAWMGNSGAVNKKYILAKGHTVRGTTKSII
jgi:hypothetical protein